jgi:hypothetical protein
MLCEMLQNLHSIRAGAFYPAEFYGEPILRAFD